MKRLMILAACAALAAGCSVKKIEYERNDKGEVSYRIYENDHWLKTEATGLSGGMSQDGRFEYNIEGLKSSPSEEFNRTMQTYTRAVIQLAQVAAAAYNPSASAALANMQGGAATAYNPSASAAMPNAAQDGSAAKAVTVNVAPAAATNTAECAGGACSEAATNAVECAGGACSETVK